MIRLEQVSLSAKDGSQQIPILRDINLHIQKGEWVAVTGLNGSGKSSLIRLFNGLLTPQTGSVIVNGLALADKADRDRIKQVVQIVFQNPEAQTIGTTPVEDLAFGLENRGMDRNEMVRRIDWALAQTGLSEVRLSHVSALSGGQRQRLAIAACLVLQPACLIFDEATSMLDPVGRREVYSLARSLWGAGVTVIWVTQRLSELLQADRILLLDGGSISYDGDARTIFYQSGIPDRLAWELPPLIKIGRVLQQQGVPSHRLPLSEQELGELVCALTYQM